MNTMDLKTAAALLDIARDNALARDLSATLRSMGLVRTMEWYQKKGESSLVRDWLRAAGLEQGQNLGHAQQ